MANKELTALPTVGSVLGTDTLYVVQSGNSGKATAQQVKDFARSDLVLTTSKIDQTIGRVAKVGDFGLGSLALAPVSNGINLDAVDNSIPPGVYAVTPVDWPGAPGVSGWWTVTHTRRAVGGGEVQTAVRESPVEVYLRTRSTGAWSAWLRLVGGQEDIVVQSDSFDATVGRVLKTPAFGLGQAATMATVEVSSGSTDLNALTKTGWCRYSSSTDANSPSDFGIVLHMTRSVASAFGGLVQLAISHNGKMYIRHNNGVSPVTYNTWAEVFSARTLIGTVSETEGAVTGAMIERGSNANGDYTRFADGTQITWQQVDVGDVDTAWGSVFTSILQTYPTTPAAFTGTVRREVTAAGSSSGGKSAWVYSNSTQFGLARATTSTGVTHYAHILTIGRWY